MKSEQLYQGLKEAAEKAGITVRERVLKSEGVPVRSGLCRLKGQYVFILDRSLPVREKIEILAECLGSWPLEDVYMVPSIRELVSSKRGGSLIEEIETVPGSRLRQSEEPEAESAVETTKLT